MILFNMVECLFLSGIVLGILLTCNVCSNHSIYGGTKEHNIEYNIQIHSNRSLDNFGIEKIYNNKLGFEWYMNMSNPQADAYLYNYHKMRKNPDGSYNIGAFQDYQSTQKMELDILKGL